MNRRRKVGRRRVVNHRGNAQFRQVFLEGIPLGMADDEQVPCVRDGRFDRRQLQTWYGLKFLQVTPRIS